MTHDVYYRAGRPNTYEMLRILLHRLETEAGGITNLHPGKGVWTFVDLKDNALLKAEAGKPVVLEKTPDGFPIVTNFASTNVFVRTEVLRQEGALSENSKLIAGQPVKVSDLVAVADLGEVLKIGSNSFKKVRILKAIDTLRSLEGMTVYISAAAF